MDRNLLCLQHSPEAFPGQARKSLWIETISSSSDSIILIGQARKSLWIETTFMYPFDVIDNGQARKSLWIET